MHSSDSNAWSADGHSAIGILAMSQLDTHARSELESIIGPLNDESMMEACNWPDHVRETDVVAESEKWKWSGPQHYINIEEGETQYEQTRDCPDGICATEAIKKYAQQLAADTASKTERWQAFAWLCHVTADLHQPMHAGFEKDRGGNSVEVVFNDKTVNLHEYWDFEVINANTNAGGLQALLEVLGDPGVGQASSDWSPCMVNDWTNKSHELAFTKGYPPALPSCNVIDDAFEQQSWDIVQTQIPLAASRLALIINTVFSDKD